MKPIVLLLFPLTAMLSLAGLGRGPSLSGLAPSDDPLASPRLRFRRCKRPCGRDASLRVNWSLNI